MLSTTKQVQTYFSERKAELSIFGVNKNKISIHSIVNLNQGLTKNETYFARINDIKLLKMVRKSKRISLEKYMFELILDPKHNRRHLNFRKWARRIHKAKLFA